MCCRMTFSHFKAALLCSLICFTISIRVEEEGNTYIPGINWQPSETSIFLVWDHPINESIWPNNVQGYVVTHVRTDKLGGFRIMYMILVGIISLFAVVDVPTMSSQLVSQPPTLMYTMKDLKPGTSYEVMISVIVNGNATIDIVRFNSSYHQMKTLGYGPDNGCRRCDIMHTKEDPICDPVTGQCNCVDELRGDTCSTCKFGAVMVMLKCQPCNCNEENSYGNCTIDASDENNVFCHCHPGFEGPTCDLVTGSSSAGSIAGGIIITLLIIGLLVGVVYVCRKRIRTTRYAHAASKWQATTSSNDYSTLTDAMEPSGTSDPFSDTPDFDGRKQLGNGSARSARNNHLSA